MSDLLEPVQLTGPEVPRFLVHMSPLHLPSERVDTLIVGGGVAGLSAALETSRAGLRTLVLVKGGREKTATNWAQGGMAAVLDVADSFEEHCADTERVAAGLAHPDVVRAIVEEAPALVDRWLRWGGEFDRTSDGELLLATEGGHSKPRIIHAHGDQTGAEIQRLLVARAQGRETIELRESTFVLDLVTQGTTVRGAIAWSHELGYHVIWAGATILCAGGCGQIWRETSNPKAATGDGQAMAYRAGAALRGMEFVQFHPTVLYVAGMARFLVSETARGEGGKLVDRTGHRFMPDYHPDAELAPRDVVSRSIVEQLGKVRDSQVYLDLRHHSEAFLQERFPVIWKACADFDIDMSRDLIPVHPACHYMIGGVATDSWGRASLEGLYACGEVASTGLHGANRMGSNSLLEGAVMGGRAGRHVVERGAAPEEGTDAELQPVRRHGGSLDPADLDAALRSTMWRLVGIQRDEVGLASARRQLEKWNHVLTQRVLGDPYGWSLINKVTVAQLVAQAAAERTESRGTHARRDFPERDDGAWRREIELVRGGSS